MMTHPRTLSAYILGVFCIFICTTTPVTARDYRTPVRAVSESKYSKAHSLGDSYAFDPRDGWQHVNVTDLRYKYRRDSFESGNTNDDDALDFEKRAKKKESTPKKTPPKNLLAGGVIHGITDTLSKIFQGLKGVGLSEETIITWYTGHDLENPSCWPDANWAPTDASFVCALTLSGWQDRPKCFKFIELCRSPQKCVFVRVVDSCAGCAKGSHHVDLTKAAFSQLADTSQGTLSVQFRPSTDPDNWYEDLWGPKMVNN